LLLAVALALGAPAGHVAAVEPPVRADPGSLMLAFLFNFPQFVEWPAEAFSDATAPFTLCIVGPQPAAEALKALERRRIRDRAVVLAQPRNATQAQACHLLFVREASAPGVATMLGAVADTPVLTVGVAPGIAAQPAVLLFEQRGDRLRWHVDLDAARKARLRLSAKLLEMAISVTGPAGGVTP
jgi:hypothetical protein